MSAPAGSGKTELLRQWCAAHQRAGVRTGWVSLEPRDDSPTRLLALFENALGVERPRGGDVSPIERPFAAGLRDLVDDVIEAGVPAALFVDDLHVVADMAVLEALASTVHALPDGITFVLASRNVIPIPLSRMRLRGSALALGWADVAFTPDEAASFLAAAHPALEAAERAALATRSDGWIAGLVLAVLSLQTGASPQRVIERLTGERGDVSAYFLENVLERQPAERRTFLLESSLLGTLGADVCDAVLGTTRSRAMLEDLAANNLFVSEAAEAPGSYRYHHLFGEFLRARLGRERPERVRELHARASAWFAARRDWRRAIAHAVEGGERERALALAVAGARERFERAAFRELEELIAALPPDDVAAHRELLTLRAWALAYAGDLRAAHESLRDATALGTGDARLEAEIAIAGAIIEVIRSDEPLAPPDPRVLDGAANDAVLRGFAHIALGYASRAGGRFDDALTHFRTAASCGATCSSLVYTLARFNVGGLQILGGRPLEAETELRDALAYAERRRWTQGLGIAFVRVQLATALGEQNRMAEAGRHLEAALITLRTGQAHGFLGVALSERARVAFALGNPAQARADIAEARAIAEAHGIVRASFRAGLVEFVEALPRDVPRAERILDGLFAAVDAEASGTSGERHELLVASRASMFAATGRGADALRVAKNGLAGAMGAGRMRHATIFLAASALAWWNGGERERAKQKLEQALSLAPGNVRCYAYAGAGLVPILEALCAEGRAKDAAAPVLALLASGGVQPARVRGHARAEREGAHLRPREREILRHIAGGLRDPEIAAQLHLSRETVKWYVKGMFDKLGVRTRAQAIASGRLLGLLDDPS